jgi:hypothetical protein
MKTKETNTATTDTVSKAKSNFRFREAGKMISKDRAIELGYAYKKTGEPTKRYLHLLACREAKKNGTPAPVRQKKTYEGGSQSHAGIASPFDLTRRSGYRVIWQVLAEHPNETVSAETLQKEVNRRLLETDPDWYKTRYSKKSPYDALSNAYVINRSPYNVPIEALKQRVVKSEGGYMLMTEVTTPRAFAKRGRKAKEVTPEVAIEPENDTAVTIVAEVAVVEAEIAEPAVAEIKVEETVTA